MTRRYLGGLIPDACQSNAVIVIVPLPLPDVSPSAAIPLGTGTGQRPLLLAAPENPYYSPVSFKFRLLRKLLLIRTLAASHSHYYRLISWSSSKSLMISAQPWEDVRS